MRVIFYRRRLSRRRAKRSVWPCRMQTRAPMRIDPTHSVLVNGVRLHRPRLSLARSWYASSPLLFVVFHIATLAKLAQAKIREPRHGRKDLSERVHRLDLAGICIISTRNGSPLK